MSPISFLVTPKYEGWNSKGITLYFPVCRKDFGLLLGGGEKNRRGERGRRKPKHDEKLNFLTTL